MDFSIIFNRFPKLERKRKEKRGNSVGPKSVQAAQQWAEARPCQRPCQLCTEIPVIWIFRSKVIALLRWVTDGLHETPRTSNSLPAEALDVTRRRLARRRRWIGRKEPRPLPSSDWPRIKSLPSISPKPISGLQPYSALPAVTASTTANPARSW
jgi:hypothetical protein